MAKKDKPKRWQDEDDIFFHRSQVRIGTELQNWGRISHGTVFHVAEIRTFHKRADGGYRPQRVETPVHLNDEIVLVSRDGKDRRRCAFHNLSYSAIWRLA